MPALPNSTTVTNVTSLYAEEVSNHEYLVFANGQKAARCAWTLGPRLSAISSMLAEAQGRHCVDITFTSLANSPDISTKIELSPVRQS